MEQLITDPVTIASTVDSIIQLAQSTTAAPTEPVTAGPGTEARGAGPSKSPGREQYEW